MLTRFSVWELSDGMKRIYINGICEPKTKIWIEKTIETEENKKLSLGWKVRTTAKKNSEAFSLIENGTIYREINSWIEGAGGMKFDDLAERIELINSAL